MFKCHADIINYLFTYLTLFCIFKFFNNITSLDSLLFNPFVCHQRTFSLPPEDIRKLDGFLMFLGGRKRVHWELKG